MEPNEKFDWTPDAMLEVSLPDPDAFLKIRETLTRIGISSKKEKKLTQSANILHKKGRYYIVSFLELFALDGKETTIGHEDIARRNTIANLLEQWGMCKILDKDKPVNMSRVSVSSIKIIPHSEKKDWELISKYSLGKR